MIYSGLGFEGWFGISIVAICIIALIISGSKDFKDIKDELRRNKNVKEKR